MTQDEVVAFYKRVGRATIKPEVLDIRLRRILYCIDFWGLSLQETKLSYHRDVKWNERRVRSVNEKLAVGIGVDSQPKLSLGSGEEGNESQGGGHLGRGVMVTLWLVPLVMPRKGQKVVLPLDLQGQAKKVRKVDTDTDGQGRVVLSAIPVDNLTLPQLLEAKKLIEPILPLIPQARKAAEEAFGAFAKLEEILKAMLGNPNI